MRKILLFIVLGCFSTLNAQNYSKITDRLNSYNPLQMVRMTSSSFLMKHEYQLEKDQKFLDKLTDYEKLSKGLAKDIAKMVSRNDWPAWIKDGIDDEEEPFFKQMVGVLLSNYKYYSNDVLIACHPDLNFQLPEKYKFKETFYFKVDNKYHYDEINPKTDNSSTINQVNIAKWHQELMQKYKSAKPLNWKAKSNWIFHYSAETVSGHKFLRSDISMLEACKSVKGTSINPYYLVEFSREKNYPMGLSWSGTDFLNSLNILELSSEISGYEYDLTKDQHKIEKTIYYYIPEKENPQFKGVVAVSPYKGIFGTIKVLYPLGDTALKYDRIDASKLKKPSSNLHTEFRIPPALSGKLSFLIQDYVNRFQNFGRGGNISEVKEGKLREIYWYDQIGYYGTDTLLVNTTTGKLSYWAYMTPYKDTGLSYQQCKDISGDIYYLLSRFNHFAGMDGFSVSRRPEIKVEGEKELTGKEAVLGKHITQYYFAHSTNFDSNYSYDRNISSNYLNNLRIRVLIKPIDEKNDKYYVYLLFFEP